MLQLHDFLATKKNARRDGSPSKGGSNSGKHQKVEMQAQAGMEAKLMLSYFVPLIILLLMTNLIWIKACPDLPLPT